MKKLIINIFGLLLLLTVMFGVYWLLDTTMKVVTNNLYPEKTIWQVIEWGYSRFCVIIIKSFAFWIPGILLVSISFNRKLLRMNDRNKIYHKE